MLENLLAHASVVLPPVVVHHFMIAANHLLMAPLHSKMCHAPNLNPLNIQFLLGWPWVRRSQMTSRVIRSQSERLPLGCGSKRDDGRTGWQISSSCIMLHTVSMSPKGMLPFWWCTKYGRTSKVCLRLALSGQRVHKTKWPCPQASVHSLTEFNVF